MIAFWAVAGVLAAAAAGLVLLRAAKAAHTPAVDPALDVYRRQVAEIDDLADQGLIGEAERKSAHAETARRLLGAADAAAAPWPEDGRGRGLVATTALIASLGTLVLYFVVGAPGAPDQPFARRIAEWRSADPTMLAPPELAAVLASVTRERPEDPQGFHYLAIAEGAAQNPAGAVRAMRRAVQLAPQRAEYWELLGEAMVAQADGEVTPQAAAAFREALKRDPKLVAARFHLARAEVVGGDKAAGLAAWRALLAELPGADPRHAALVSAIAEAEGRPQPPRTVPQDQMAMIQGMVQSLAQRLDANPEDPDGWVRLVRAYAVLGDAAKRDDALRQARARYAGKPDILSQLEAAARAEPMQ